MLDSTGAGGTLLEGDGPRTRRAFAPRALRSAGGYLVALLAAVALAAPLLAPYDPHRQLDPAAGRYRPPGTVLALVEIDGERTLLADRVRRTAAGLEVERLGRREVYPADRVRNLTAEGVSDRRVFLLGTDGFGRDLLSRILYGGRISLGVAVLAVALALGVGLLVGSLAGAGPRLVDAVLMRGVDALLAFPWLFLVLALTALLRPSTALVVVVLGATSWMTVSRLVRAEILSLAQREFILAARGLGLHPARILFRHLLPNALNPVVVEATLAVGNVILAESALSFLGLGVQPPTASWGNIVADGRDVLQTAWWVSTFPGLAIVLAVLAFNLLGDRLRDVLDPRTR
ncbi:MAG TPA: ABC transporter permease [Thermoanaerobaculia bacterium]|nr:ABC transporter permease [Thermoanaerobaculia bacterium]